MLPHYASPKLIKRYLRGTPPSNDRLIPKARITASQWS